VKKKTAVRYSEEFRNKAMERMKTSRNITALAQELGVSREALYRWREALQANPSQKPDKAGPQDREKFSLQQQLQQAQQLLAQKTLEVDFLKGALQRIAARGRSSTSSGATTSTNRSNR